MPKRNEEVPVQQEDEIKVRHVRIGIMGPVGAGKSTLAGLLSESWGGAEVIDEKYPDNPHLEPFYEEPEKHSFKSQTWFLTKRMEQLSYQSYDSLKIEDPAQRMNYLFAFVQYKMGWMTDNEWQTYQGIYEALMGEGKIKDPDIFVAVNAPFDVLAQRIRDRDREYELLTLEEKPEYFEMLSSAVSDWARNMEENHRVVEVNSNSMDYSGNKNNRDLVVKYIEDRISVHFQRMEGKGADGIELIFPEVFRKD
ncbi:deoxynucleoside kinase [Patescibacteria group bacterium]|nr:deoxynucleoside kinase [Patescibacteria group bacterium]